MDEKLCEKYNGKITVETRTAHSQRSLNKNVCKLNASDTKTLNKIEGIIEPISHRGLKVQTFAIMRGGGDYDIDILPIDKETRDAWLKEFGENNKAELDNLQQMQTFWTPEGYFGSQIQITKKTPKMQKEKGYYFGQVFDPIQQIISEDAQLVDRKEYEKREKEIEDMIKTMNERQTEKKI